MQSKTRRLRRRSRCPRHRRSNTTSSLRRVPRGATACRCCSTRRPGRGRRRLRTCCPPPHMPPAASPQAAACASRCRPTSHSSRATPSALHRHTRTGSASAQPTTPARRASSQTAPKMPASLPSTVSHIVHCFLLSHTPPDNQRREVGVRARGDSPIIGLRNLNNWIKSVLIAKFGRSPLQESATRRGRTSGKVLDIGCGKGGDLRKWFKANIAEYVGLGTSLLSLLARLTPHRHCRCLHCPGP